MRVGLLGGTFDPVHIGHLFIAEEAHATLKLENVYFVPAGEPPHKMGEPVTSAEHRVAMVRLAIAANEHFALSLVDVDRPGPSYSVDMVRLFRQALGKDAKIYFIMGLDSFLDLPNWHRPDELIRMCELVVVRRPGYRQDVAMLECRIPGLSERARFVRSPMLDISSTDIERRVRAGQPIRYLVPDVIADYIYAHNLYHQPGQPRG